MNSRRTFFSTLATAVAGFTILPPATTYARIWKATKEPNIGIDDGWTLQFINPSLSDLVIAYPTTYYHGMKIPPMVDVPRSYFVRSGRRFHNGLAVFTYQGPRPIDLSGGFGNAPVLDKHPVRFNWTDLTQPPHRTP